MVTTLILWLMFILFTALFLIFASVFAHYGLKLIDKIERWYKGKDKEDE